MRLNQFQFLIALEKYGTISKAAQVLFIAQPSLSAAIKELEEELGFAILSRSKKGVAFTPQGELVLAEAKVIMEAVNRIKHIEYQENGDLKGRLRVGGIPYFCDMLLLKALMSLRQNYPNLTIQLTEEDSGSLLKLVAEEVVDIGIILISYTSHNELRTEMNKIKVNYSKLFDDQMCFIARQGHPLLRQESVAIETVMGYPFVTHRKSVSPVTESLLQRYGASQQMLHISGLNNLRRFILMSEAISVFPSWAINDSFTMAGKIQIIQVADFVWPCQVGWISRNDSLTAAEAVFVQALTEQCQLMIKQLEP